MNLCFRIYLNILEKEYIRGLATLLNSTGLKSLFTKKRNICINDLVFSPELFQAFKSKAGVVHANFFKTFFLSRKNSFMFYKKKTIDKKVIRLNCKSLKNTGKCQPNPIILQQIKTK